MLDQTYREETRPIGDFLVKPWPHPSRSNRPSPSSFPCLKSCRGPEVQGPTLEPSQNLGAHPNGPDMFLDALCVLLLLECHIHFEAERPRTGGFGDFSKAQLQCWPKEKNADDFAKAPLSSLKLHHGMP